jgi:hypothetical protein
MHPTTNDSPQPTSPDLSVIAQLVPHTWSEAINLLLAAHLYGTSAGRKLARAHIGHMANVADIGCAAIALLREQASTEAAVFRGQVDQLLAQAKAILDAAPATGLDVGAPSPESSSLHHPTEVGRLARQLTGQDFELQVCYCAVGFYLGTVRDDEPFTRESVEYWPRREQATTALATGNWRQRAQP